MTVRNPAGPSAAVYKRVGRRETHSPRSALAIILACVLIVCALWAATEIVLANVGAAPLWVSPAAILAAVFSPPELPSAMLISAGALLGLAGIALMLAAITPGRKARHLLDTPAGRVLAVVDNEVVASALARRAAEAGGVSPDNVEVAVSHRTSRVFLIPVSGNSVDSVEVSDAVTARVDTFALKPPVTVAVQIARKGKVGA